MTLERTRLIACVAALIVAGTAVAQDGVRAPDNDTVDRDLFHQLTAKVRQIDRDYARVVDQAMKQARAGDGRADLELQAQMLSLREARDRTMSRLIIVASRHGWEIPDFDAERKAAESTAPDRSPAETVFEPAARIVRERFAAEARRIAWRLPLPVISVPRS